MLLHIVQKTGEKILCSSFLTCSREYKSRISNAIYKWRTKISIRLNSAENQKSRNEQTKTQPTAKKDQIKTIKKLKFSEDAVLCPPVKNS